MNASVTREVTEDKKENITRGRLPTADCCGRPYKVFLLFAMSVTVSLPPVAPPLASETAVSQSGGPITPTSDQVKFISSGTTSASNSSWGPGGRTICCMLCYLSFYLSLYPSSRS
jgi:hypothetical protein